MRACGSASLSTQARILRTLTLCLSEQGNNGMGNIGQKESNHWISKLKRLMDQGYTQEEAEMALRKHNMNFDTALSKYTRAD